MQVRRTQNDFQNKINDRNSSIASLNEIMEAGSSLTREQMSRSKIKKQIQSSERCNHSAFDESRNKHRKTFEKPTRKIRQIRVLLEQEHANERDALGTQLAGRSGSQAS